MALAALALLAAWPAFAQTTRIASDFEIQQMEQQAAREHDFIAQVSAHLNLGDLRTSRNESSLAQAEYRTALQIAQDERLRARNNSDFRRYALATMYAGLANATMNRGAAAYELLEEGLRYASDDARNWNLYASAMNTLQQPAKAAGAERNAVAIAEAAVAANGSMSNRLDLAIDQYGLALALSATHDEAAAQTLLETVVSSLGRKEFDPLRKAVARAESFEIYSTVRSEAAAYVSLLNRSQLRLAELYENRGLLANARKVYEDVVHDRTDDPTALAALVRLSGTDAERAEAYAEAFDANPFSLDLIRQYEDWLRTHPTTPNSAATDGALMRRALEQRALRENVAARETLDALAAKFPHNDVVQYLAARNDIELGELDRARSRSIGIPELQQQIRSRLAGAAAKPPAFLSTVETAVNPTPGELRQLFALIEQERITPAERVRLDSLTLTSAAVFDSASVSEAQTTLTTGTMYGIRFRFTQPTVFAGTFAAKTPLVLTYRILGITDLDGARAFLLEPVKVEATR